MSTSPDEPRKNRRHRLRSQHGRSRRKPRVKNRAQELRCMRMLYAKVFGGAATYDEHHHPDSLVAFFQKELDAIIENERVETVHGQVSYVQRPVTPPTLGGYAAQEGVSTSTLWTWSKQYPEFEFAMERAKAIQEAVFLRMGASGAYPASVMALMMKNLHGWQDKVENTHKGDVTLKFDAQDEEA